MTVLESSRTSPRPRGSSRTILKSLVLALRLVSLTPSLDHEIELCAEELGSAAALGGLMTRGGGAPRIFIGGGGVALWSAETASDRTREH